MNGLVHWLLEIPFPGFLPGGSWVVYVWLLVATAGLAYILTNLWTAIRWRRNLRRFRWNGKMVLASRYEIAVHSVHTVMATMFLGVGVLVALTPPDPRSQPAVAEKPLYVLSYVMFFLLANLCLLGVAFLRRQERRAVYVYGKHNDE